jgi:indole-3-glycerol phosphate synthase
MASESSNMSSVPDLPATLREIVEHKRTEVEAAKAAVPLSVLTGMISDSDPARDFVGSITTRAASGRTAVIAEIKRRSPSAGLIRPEYADGFDPVVIAQGYSKAGASAISCLTDEKFFGGDLAYLQRVRSAVDLPVLRKDFLIDPYQIHEARAHGADAVLLIAECLSDKLLCELFALTGELGMGVLVETHDPENIDRVLKVVASGENDRYLIGINNRNLRTMSTDLAHTTDLVARVPDPTLLVSESGIRTNADLIMLSEHGVRIVLVGEHLMRQPSPGEALSELLFDAIKAKDEH